MKAFKQGFTLLELIFSIAIVSIIVFGAIPSFANLIANYRADGVASGLTGIVQSARQAAVERGIASTICPTRDQLTCSLNWADGAMVFIDANEDRAVAPNEMIISYLPAISSSFSLEWRSFQSKPYIQYSPRGYTLSHNGTFILCPSNNDPSLARLLILNKAGRLRKGLDKNGDGIQERANGKPVECS